MEIGESFVPEVPRPERERVKARRPGGMRLKP